MNSNLNQLLQNITALNGKLSQLIEAGDLARHSSLVSSGIAKPTPYVCEELQMSLSSVIYHHVN